MEQQHLVDGDEEDNPPAKPKKGRSNAILTYQKLDEFFHKLTEVATVVGSIKEDLRAIVQKSNDLEVRLRVLEVTVAAMQATTITKKDEGRWVITLLTSLCTLLIGATTAYLATSK